MQAPPTPTTILPVPEIDSDEPVAVIPTASVAPLEGPPDGERINTFTLAPQNDRRMLGDVTASVIGDMRERVLSKPLTYVAAAFSLGLVLARMLR
jgi:hypothetical protein